MPPLRAEDRYDSLFQWYWHVTAQRFGFDTSADWRLLKAMARQKSTPDATTPRPGALRRMPLMERGDLALDGTRNADNPEVAIREGALILAGMWATFKAAAGLERFRVACAAYHGGPRDIVRAQAFLQQRDLPRDQWVAIAMVLPEVTMTATARETVEYVRRVFAEFDAARAMPEPAHA
ncbi:MAG: hypothetical protein FJ027_20125 [Candidatus Rokubacteria bacterium]|nr:hypothetical protein [Candidatus Rokubacteria bacterium]